MHPALALGVAYVAGSVPSAYLAGRLVKGVDLRTVGSGNLGATNVYRNLGAPAAIVVLLADALKGGLPVALLPGLIEHRCSPGVRGGFLQRLETGTWPGHILEHVALELLTLAGGEDIFPELARQPMGKDRIIADGQQIVARAPDIVIGSWCGKKFRPEKVAQRPGWQDVPAVRDGQLFEIKSADILQPGPAALTDGVAQLHRIIAQWVARHG